MENGQGSQEEGSHGLTFWIYFAVRTVLNIFMNASFNISVGSLLFFLFMLRFTSDRTLQQLQKPKKKAPHILQSCSLVSFEDTRNSVIKNALCFLLCWLFSCLFVCFLHICLLAMHTCKVAAIFCRCWKGDFVTEKFAWCDPGVWGWLRKCCTVTQTQP